MSKKKKTFLALLSSPKKLLNLFRVFSKKEKIIFTSLFVLAFASALFLGLNFYYENTTVVPSYGGQYREGIVGQPRFINPVYLSDNDLDRDLVELLFSGLLKYGENGEIVKDMAEDYTVINEGQDYEFKIRKNAKWHDGEAVTADDVIFTVDLVQSPSYRSSLRVEWLGVTTEKKDNKTIVFHLPKEYSLFPETVASLKILPKHVFKDIPPENLPWSLVSKEYLQGSGPYKLSTLKKNGSGFIEKIVLERNDNYYDKKPYIDEIQFLLYKEPRDLVGAAKKGEIDGFSVYDPKYSSSLNGDRFKSYKLEVPRYFALFFNFNNSELLSEKAVREAISLGINKSEIVKEVFNGKAEEVNSPILPNFFNFEEPESILTYNPEQARQILSDNGFILNEETGIREREKVNEADSPFQRALEEGDEGSDVSALQECLAKDSEVYPDGTVSGYFGPKTEAAVTRFQEKYASDILAPIGLSSGTGRVAGMTIDKLNEVCLETPKESTTLSLTITTSESFPLVDIAEVIKNNLRNIGIDAKVNSVSLGELQTEVLKNRNFEALLFGEALGILVDPFSFWHSSQIEYPGLNITGYNSTEADELLETARQTSDEEERKEALENFQNIILEDTPATFIARGNYFYYLDKKVRGMNAKKITDPSKRFSGIENWYTDTKRSWK